jgi:hypothetical protein
MDLLHIWVKGELIKGELIFIYLVDIPSYPEEFLGLRDFIMFLISLVDIMLPRLVYIDITKCTSIQGEWLQR